MPSYSTEGIQSGGSGIKDSNILRQDALKLEGKLNQKEQGIDDLIWVEYINGLFNNVGGFFQKAFDNHPEQEPA